jgi:hypothetical protein
MQRRLHPKFGTTQNYENSYCHYYYYYYYYYYGYYYYHHHLVVLESDFS